MLQFIFSDWERQLLCPFNVSSCSFAWHSSPHYCTLWFSYCASMYLVSVYHVSMYSVPLANETPPPSEMIGFSNTNWFPFALDFLHIFSIQYDEHVYRLLWLSNGRKIYGRLSNAWKLGKMCDLVNFRSIILFFSSIYSFYGCFMLKYHKDCKCNALERLGLRKDETGKHLVIVISHFLFLDTGRKLYNTMWKSSGVTVLLACFCIIRKIHIDFTI